MWWRESVLAVAILVGASVPPALAPTPHHGFVARFHVHAAGCHVAGSSRPVSLEVVCS
jgi:hypothetical protein